MRWINERRPVVGFAIASVLFLYISISAQSLVSWVQHTYEVSSELDTIGRYLSDVESSQRGYLLTNEVEYLDRYQRNIPLITPILGRIKVLTSDNPRQGKNIKNLESLVKQKLKTINDGIEARQLGGLEFAASIIRTNKGKLVMDEIQSTLLQMKEEESILLRKRARDATNLLTFEAVGGFSCIAWVIFILNNKIDDLVITDKKNRILNEELEIRVLERTKDLENANRSKDLFLSVLSHELRTPLTAIIGWTKLLKDGSLLQERLAEALSVIERSAKAQQLLVDDVLDISRIIQGKFQLTVRPIDINKVIEQALLSLSIAIEGKGIKVYKVLDTNRSPISGDPERLQQVLWNILSNAVKFTNSRTGRIEVKTERIDSYLVVSIADNGIGIDPAFLPYIFDRFRQADSSITRVHGGLGLGLAIALQIVQLHGGSISAASEGQGKGSTFTIKLPIAIAYKPLSSSPDPIYSAVPSNLDFQPSSALSGLTVLLVDDHDDARQVLKISLEQSGATVIEANSVDMAMNIVVSRLPDVIISDIGMPVKDGYSFIKEVRALPAEKGGNIPAAAVTAYARDEDRMHSLDVGFQAHITKPVELEYLISAVASLAGRGRSL